MLNEKGPPENDFESKPFLTVKMCCLLVPVASVSEQDTSSENPATLRQVLEDISPL